MHRADKIKFVEDLNRRFTQSPHVLLATFRGLTVNQANALRIKVRELGGGYRVIKNRLAKRAAEGTAMEPLSEAFEGPCAVATHDSDPVALAKALTEFAKDNPQVQLLAGVIDAKERIDAAGVKALAALPALPQLQAQLLALILTPATTLVRLINTPGGQVARVIDAHREAQQGSAEG